MQAISFPARNAVETTILPDPRPGPGEVVVEVHASGICHTDIEVLRGNYGTSAFPLVPGHEYAGAILELGPEVEGLHVGDRVVADPNVECGTCRACRRGWAHLCDTLGAYGVTRNGGLAERSVVRASAVHPIGDMPYAMAALAEPLGCVLNGLGAAQASLAENALIFGAGPIGLLLGVGLRINGVSEVTFVEVDEARVKFAKEFGFHAIDAGSPDLASWHREADLAIDATGVPEVAENLIRYIANGGKGLFFGVCPSDASIRISPFELFRRQITIAGSHSLNHNIPDAIAALRAFGSDVAQVVSHKLPLEEVAQVIAEGAPAGSLKIQFVPK